MRDALIRVGISRPSNTLQHIKACKRPCLRFSPPGSSWPLLALPGPSCFLLLLLSRTLLHDGVEWSGGAKSGAGGASSGGPGAARRSQGELGGARRCQEEPRGARRNHGPGGNRRSQKKPGGARGSQEKPEGSPGGAQGSWAL
jgi:hypothetical protein